jgi:hypothetical protein
LSILNKNGFFGSFIALKIQMTNDHNCGVQQPLIMTSFFGHFACKNHVIDHYYGHVTRAKELPALPKKQIRPLGMTQNSPVAMDAVTRATKLIPFP